MAKIKSA